MVKTNKEDIIKVFSQRIKQDIGKSPEEINSNSMTTIKMKFERLYRPNNYRRQIEVETVSNSTKLKIKSAIGEKNCNLVEHTKLLFIKNFKGLTVQIAKNKITAILSQNVISGKKETFLFNGSTEFIENSLLEKKEEYKKLLDEAVNFILKKFKIIKTSKIYWSRAEDWTNDENYILDKFKKDAVIHEEFLKIVYDYGGEITEKIGTEEPTIKLIRHMKNSALNDLQPEIVENLILIHERIDAVKSPLVWLKNNVNSYSDMQNNLSLVENLNRSDLISFGYHLLNKFGVGIK